jgi:peptidyl-prolyl cis-trans isomerase A (cyclophilin A)
MFTYIWKMHLINKVKIVMLLAISITLIGCDGFVISTKKKKKKTVQIQEMDTIPLEPIVIDTNLINNSNVAQKLSAFANENTETSVKIVTRFGNITCVLYKDTPLHRANLIMLTKNGYFDSTLFYRIIPNFMIQGGNSDRDNTYDKMKKIGNYTIPEEIKSNHFHKSGALAMAVSEQLDIAPELRTKNSSPYNFYIVTAPSLSDEYMDALEEEYKITIPEFRREVYRKIGGTPHLDDLYTVFGEVTSGMSVVKKIANVEKDFNDFPLEYLFLSVEITK